jgi:hypothetical protein
MRKVSSSRSPISSGRRRRGVTALTVLNCGGEASSKQAAIQTCGVEATCAFSDEGGKVDHSTMWAPLAVFVSRDATFWAPLAVYPGRCVAREREDPHSLANAGLADFE